MFKSFKIQVLTVFLLVVVLSLQSASALAISKDSFTRDAKNDVLNRQIEDFLKENYKGYYDLKGFRFAYRDSEEFPGAVEINVGCDMTLLKPVEDLPMMQGMKQALDGTAMQSISSKEAVDVYRETLDVIEEKHFQVPNKTTFTFIIPNNASRELRNVQVLNDFEILGLDSLKINDNELKNEGRELLQQVLSGQYFKQASTLRSSGYDRKGARDYALAHVYDPPKYSSDCANFVSNCLHYGGGISTTSAWYPGSVNWIRTGYNKNGGVVPYMVNRGLFYREPNRSKVAAGAIASRNDKSHVYLVTYGDTVTIKVTAHTNARKNIVMPASENVSYYMYK